MGVCGAQSKIRNVDANDGPDGQFVRAVGCVLFLFLVLFCFYFRLLVFAYPKVLRD